MTDTTSPTPPTDASAPPLTLADRARLRLLKWRLDWHLEGRVPRRRRNEITREVRANVVAAAADHGVAGAIERLGDVSAVAQEYVEAEASRVRVRVGFIAAMAVVMGLYVLGLVVSVAFSEGARAVAGDDASWSYAWEVAEGFGPFASSHDAEEGVYTVTVLSPFHLLAGLVAFVLGARLWRWRPHGRR